MAASPATWDKRRQNRSGTFGIEGEAHEPPTVVLSGSGREAAGLSGHRLGENWLELELELQKVKRPRIEQIECFEWPCVWATEGGGIAANGFYTGEKLR